MAIKKSVRLVDETMTICANMSAGGDINWSRSINNMAELFNLFITDNTPELTENEWNVFYYIYNGYMPHPIAAEEAKLLSWHIIEGYRNDELVRQFLTDETQAIKLVVRVKSWSTSQRLAVIYKAKALFKNGQVAQSEFNE